MRPVDPRLPRQATAARAGLAVATGLGLVTTGLVVAQAWLLARSIASVSGGTPAAQLAGPLAWLSAVVLLRSAVAYGTELVAGRAAAATKRQLRLGLVERAVRLGPEWLARHGTGGLGTLATRGLDALDGYFARFLPQLVLATTVPVAVVVLLAGVDWPSAAAVALTVPLIPLFMALVGLHTQARTERGWDQLQRLGGHFLDVVEGLPTLVLFRRAKAQVATVRRVTEEHRAATMATLRIAFLSALVLELLATLATAVVAVEVGLRLLAGGLPYETALFVLLLTPEAYLPLRRVGAEYHASREGAVAASRALDVLAEPVPADQPGSRPAPAVLRIRLDRVDLDRSGRGRPALAGVSLSLGPAERVALVGPSGAGKSSVLALLLRFAEPTGGRLLVGGQQLSGVDVGSWRRRVAWVPQRPRLLTGTVADNIRLGVPGATDDDVARAAGLAALDRPAGGWDTPVGEAGCRLSTGQRQRVALARAFLRVLVDDVPLLLLDEPTAHLDAATATAVRAGVTALSPGRIVVVVAHDEQWAAWADRVVHLDRGRLRPEPRPVEPVLAVAG